MAHRALSPRGREGLLLHLSSRLRLLRLSRIGQPCGINPLQVDFTKRSQSPRMRRVGQRCRATWPVSTLSE